MKDWAARIFGTQFSLVGTKKRHRLSAGYSCPTNPFVNKPPPVSKNKNKNA